MAPSGQKLGKLVHPACMHSPFAKAFQTPHLCWQDRISKEQNSQMAVKLQPKKEQPLQKSKSLADMSALELARHEYHPIGGAGPLNNHSGQISATLGPKNWAPSGGLKSEYRSQVGKASLTAFGAPAHETEADMSASYLPKQVRSEGRRKARADQLEAIRQHGVGTILRFQGDGPAAGYAAGPLPESGGRRQSASGGGSVRSRLASAESWGSVPSNPEDEVRRITELGAKAREIGKQAASAQQVNPVVQRGERTILGGKDKMPDLPLRNAPGTGDSHRYSRVSTGSGASSSFGSVYGMSPDDELRRIHEMADHAREIAKRGAHAHQRQASRQDDEHDMLERLRHPH